MALEKMGMDKCVVTVFADDNKKYLSTDYTNEFEAKDEYISSHIELLSVKTYR